MARKRALFSIGHRSEKLTVVSDAPIRDKHNHYKWLCECECGTRKYIAASHLLSKKTVSCGCITGPKVTDATRGQTAVLNRYRKQAVDRGLCWELSREFAVSLLGSRCFYCGIEPNNIHKIEDRAHKADRQYLYNGMDRVDSSEGYVVGNVVPACKQCNVAKSDYTTVDFIQWATRLAAFQERLKYT